MKYLDRFLQRWRIGQVLRQLPSDIRLIDLGAHQGELFQRLGDRLTEGFGIEPLLDQEVRSGPNYVIRRGYFPNQRPNGGGWDCITMLAVLEHIPGAQQETLARACHDLLRDGGRVVITVPTRAVDSILALLRFLHLIDGMSLEEHWGFEPGTTSRIFAPPRFVLVSHRRFQLGLNHLFVFEKCGAAAPRASGPEFVAGRPIV
jgi:SAM-dependent methyltransferase